MTIREILDRWPAWANYVMRFTRYGHPEEHTRDSLTECLHLANFLEDCGTWDFDQYGILEEVECVGRGVIPDDEWDQILEVFQADWHAFEAIADAEPEEGL